MTIQELLSLGSNVTEMGYLLTALYGIVLWLLARFVLRMYNRVTKRIIEIKGKKEATTAIFVGNVLRVAIYAVAVYLLLVQFTALKSLSNLLLGASSILGVAVTLAAQESVSQLVGGMFLSLYQPFRVNDLIHLPEKGITGRIKEIGMRHTVVITASNTEVVIPNSTMNSTIIENRDLGDFYNNMLVFPISYRSDHNKAMEIIEEEVKKHPLLLPEKKEEVKVILLDFTTYAINLRVSFATFNAADGFVMSADLRKSVKEAFEKAQIELPVTVTQIIKNN